MRAKPKAHVVAKELLPIFIEDDSDSLREHGTGVCRSAVMNRERFVGVTPQFELKRFFFGP